MHFVRSKIASPFQLEKPVNPINFAGRQTVLKNIRQMVGNMLVGSPSQALLCGQSGMGKTSLLHYLRNTYSQKKLLVIDIENPVSTSDFIIQIVEVILKKSVKEPHYMKIRGLFEDSIIADKSEKEIYDLKDNKLIPRNDLKFMPDYDELEYLKGNLKSHILPNGICSKSTKLTTCPVVDACLSCTYFKTSKQFLSVHKEQLAILKTRLPIYEANGWTPNLVTTKRQIQELEDLITRLETQEDSDGNKEITTSISTTTI